MCTCSYFFITAFFFLSAQKLSLQEISSNITDINNNSLNDTDVDATDQRKKYGLSFSDGCPSYRKVFKCMTSCKSIGYDVYRIDRRCKCKCYKYSTTTELPWFIWHTNGTTRKIPTTHSPYLYDIYGTASATPLPPTTTTTEETVFTCPTLETQTVKDEPEAEETTTETPDPNKL